MNDAAAVIQFPVPDGSATWTAEVDAFLLSMRARRLSPNTQESYKSCLRLFRASLVARGRSLDPTSIVGQDVALFLVEQTEQGFKPTTLLQRFAVLRTFFRHLERELDDYRSPMTRMQPPKVPRSLVPIVDPADVDRLMATCSGKSFVDRRDAAILSLMLSTGARRSEVIGVLLTDDRGEPADLNLPAGEITFYGKGETTRTVRFGDRTALAITRYLRDRARHARANAVYTVGRTDIPRRGRPLWLPDANVGTNRVDPGRGGLSGIGLHAMLKRRCRAAGINPLHLHQLRHTWTDGVLQLGMNEGDVARLGGWTTTKMIHDRYGASAADRRARKNYLDPMDMLFADGARHNDR